MPLSVAQEYYVAIDVLMSAELIDLAFASAYPHSTEEGRKKYIKDLNKSAKLLISDEGGKVLSVEDAAKKLAMTMRG